MLKLRILDIVRRYRAFSIILPLLMGLTGCNTSSQNPISITETDQGFTVAEGSDTVMVYQREHKSLDGKYTRANYIHPLYSLDGDVLTEDFPPDHPHHRGVFWAWHQVWIGRNKIGDPWATVDTFWDVYDAKVLTPDSDTRALKLHVHWKSPKHTDSAGQQIPYMKETTTITVHRAQDDMRKIDFQIELLALEDNMRLGGSEDEKGYGGFSTRVILAPGLVFTGTDGEINPTNLSLEAGPWVDISGNLANATTTNGIAILCHGSSPGYPQRWILRRQGSAQNPVYPGREPVDLSKDKPLILRYRLILHRGNVNDLDLDRLQAEYNSEPLN